MEPLSGKEAAARVTGMVSAKHQVHGYCTPDYEPRERGLQRQGERCRQDHRGGSHWLISSAVSRAGVGVSTTSTSSRLEKSTAGLTTMRR